MAEGTENNFESDEERTAKALLGRLTDVAHEGALWSDWSQTFCSKKLLKWLDEQVEVGKSDWLGASDAEAQAIRYRTQGYRMIKSWIASHIQSGNAAAQGIKEFHKEGIELEGLIKLPPPPK